MQHGITQQTAAIRAGIDTDSAHGAVIPPLYLSSNYSFKALNEPRKYDYSRSGNPTRDCLGDAIAKLESGAGAVITASGMAAISLVLQLLSPSDTLIASADCYGGTLRLFKALSERGAFHLKLVNLNDLGALRAQCEAGVSLIWVETPSNPLLRVYDIRKISALAHTYSAQCVVDNTFLSPALQTPILLGADIVVHSTTKFINGHSDVVGGAVIARNKSLHETLAWWANCLGITGAPFDSYQTLRGLRTLHVRQHAQECSTREVIGYLRQATWVKKVHHPSLPHHPDHDLAAQQQKGFGSMISLEVDFNHQQLSTFLNNLELFSLAESLGGIESLVCHPASMTHAALCEADQIRAGISPPLLRLSIGLESATDLIRDLTKASALLTSNTRSAACLTP